MTGYHFSRLHHGINDGTLVTSSGPFHKINDAISAVCEAERPNRAGEPAGHDEGSAKHGASCAKYI